MAFKILPFVANRAPLFTKARKAIIIIIIATAITATDVSTLEFTDFEFSMFSFLLSSVINIFSL